MEKDGVGRTGAIVIAVKGLWHSRALISEMRAWRHSTAAWGQAALPCDGYAGVMELQCVGGQNQTAGRSAHITCGPKLENSEVHCFAFRCVLAAIRFHNLIV